MDFNKLLKDSIPYIIAILSFLILSYAYFPEQIKGKEIKQHDVQQWKGMNKEIADYKAQSGEHSLWTNSMFSGMPTYLITTPPNKGLIPKISRIFNLNYARPAAFIFLYLTGFFIALLCFKVNPWLSMAISLGFAFSSYSIIIISAGHLTKAVAIGYMPAIIGGVHLAFNRKLFLGALIMSLFLALQLLTNHLQITYYSLITILIYGIVFLIYSAKRKELPRFFKTTGVLVVAALLALSTNISNIYFTWDYGKDSIRGKSELSTEAENRTSGLDKDYATMWSLGKWETLCLFIPNFSGGPSSEGVGTDSELYDELRRSNVPNAASMAKSIPAYWGPQPGTSPVYFGAVIMMLFIFSLFILKGPIKQWLVASVIISILLSWGNNFMFLTDLFLEYFPGYNKFRTVTMILVIAQFAVCVAAALAIKQIIENNTEKKDERKALKWSGIITGGTALIFALFPGIFLNFEGGVIEEQLRQAQWPENFIEALKKDRAIILKQDALRTLFFVALTIGALYLFISEKIKVGWFTAVIAILILTDLWMIDKRYLNNDNFERVKENAAAFPKYAADDVILSDNDPYFRVYDLTASSFQSARASYFHKSIGGYHGAKMRRYQELIENQIAQNNMSVLRMLNVKYLIRQQGQGVIAQPLPGNLGNAWFADSIIWAQNADNEIELLSSFNPAKEVIIDERFRELANISDFGNDTSATIQLTEYKPDELSFTYNSNSKQLAVFSDIYYNKGWKAYIDDELQPHFRVNYVLRGMALPEGEHNIRFEFKPDFYKTAIRINQVSSVVLMLLLLGVMFKNLKKKYAQPKD